MVWPSRTRAQISLVSSDRWQVTMGSDYSSTRANKNFHLASGPCVAQGGYPRGL
jgi:hypothetical protein